jgi:hypothetical protein
MQKHLHIVAFDVPYPADYGGVIDIFHKLRWLKKLNVSITLHCFQYGREQQIILNEWCEKVYYYKRSKYKNPFIGTVPYIVSTRSNDELLENLCKDNFPIIFEGIHCTYFLTHKKLKNRIQIVRNHNIEHDYYKSLELIETNFFKKYFFRNESDLLKQYEKVLKHAQQILAISPSDHEYLQKNYQHSVLVPAFHANDSINIKPGKGSFLLYHGNLSVGENNHAALFLVNQVFSQIKYPVVIAGNKPSPELVNACKPYPHIQLISNWSNEEIMNAVSDAQINILPTFQGTGIKLKLLNALFIGKFCLVNELMVQNTGLEKACIISKNAEEMIKDIHLFWNKEFDDVAIAHRKKVLMQGPFNNEHNTQTILALI